MRGEGLAKFLRCLRIYDQGDGVGVLLGEVHMKPKGRARSGLNGLGLRDCGGSADGRDRDISGMEREACAPFLVGAPELEGKPGRDLIRSARPPRAARLQALPAFAAL